MCRREVARQVCEPGMMKVGAEERKERSVQGWNAVPLHGMSGLWGSADHWDDAICHLTHFSCLCPACRDLGEECDDMNKINGDGCSLFCLQELSFNCIGKSGSEPFHLQLVGNCCMRGARKKNQQYFQHLQLKSCHGRGKKVGICRFERRTYLPSFWSF